MKIFDKSNQTNQGELYLALCIGEKKVKSGIWTFKQKLGQVLAYGGTESWSGTSMEELIAASDTSISSAIAKLPEVSGREPTKVILGLPESWLDNNNVKESRAKILHAVCRKLLVKPLGFVVTPESITHFLKKEEGDLMSVVLINLEETEITVSLIVQGKYLGSQVVSRSNSLAMDLEEGLLRFDYSGVLPPRIILVDGESLEPAKQSLLSYPWVSPEKQKRVSFIQLPRVDFAADDLEIQSIVLAGSRELDPNAQLAVPSEIIVSKEVEPKIETIIEETEEPEKPLEIPEPPMVAMVEDFGFVTGKDISLEEGFEQELVTEPASQIQFNQMPVIQDALPEEAETVTFPSSPKKRLFSKFLSLFRHLPKKPSRPSVKIGKFLPKKGLVFFGLGLAMIFGLFVLCYSQVVKAQVNLLAQPAVVEKEIEFSVSDKIDQPDTEKKLLPLRVMTDEQTGSKTTEVKGRKVIGDKAAGEVVIYNGSDKKKTIPQGTLIKGPSDLKYVLDQEVTIPARSTDISSTPPVDKWGEGKVTIAAKDIGAQYNLAANSTLALESSSGSASAVIVRNPTEFSGGTSREISAVSKEDREQILKDLQKELEERARANLKEKGQQMNLLTDTFKLDNKTDKYNHEAGDEAQELVLEEKAVFSISYFENADADKLINQEVAALIPNGYQKQAFDQKKEITLKDKSNKQYSIKIKLSFYPEADLAKIAGQMNASLLPKAKEILTSLPFVAGYEITVSPKIFSILPIMPLKSKNITINLKSM